MAAFNRDDYAKRSTEDLRKMIKQAEGRMSRCVDMQGMLTDMYAVQEMEAALAARAAA